MWNIENCSAITLDDDVFEFNTLLKIFNCINHSGAPRLGVLQT